MRSPASRVAKMRRHIDDLLARHTRPNSDDAIRVRWIRRANDAGIARAGFGFEVVEISLMPVRSAVSYAVALHEIGHMLGRYQHSHDVLVRESWAWKWARRNALYWSPAMEEYATDALLWYVERRRQAAGGSH